MTQIVPLDEVPGLNPLARLLAAGDQRARPFLPDAPDRATIEGRAREALAAFRPRTVETGDSRLDAFARGERAVVVTGQQAGLFTGPVLTLVKAAAARALANELSLGAVFWCASEDHDLVEATRVPLPGESGPEDAGPDPAGLTGNLHPVGALPAGAYAAKALEAALRFVPGKDPADPLFVALREGAEGSFLEGFRKTFRIFLGDAAPPVHDAARARDKPDLVPLAIRLVRERAAVRELLAGRAAELTAAGFALQVTSDPHALPLFLLDDGVRRLLREEGGVFRLKGRDDAFSEEEIVARLESGALTPSFSALTRPLAASVLYPVAATILGPSEIAYWAQMLPLFGWAGLPRPVIVPRPMTAFLDPQSRRALEKSGLRFADVLGGRNALLTAAGAGRAAAALARVEALKAGFLAGLEDLAPELTAVDATLGAALATTREKVSFALDKLTEKSAQAAARADGTLEQKMLRLSVSLAPNGTLAERVYTPLHLVLRYGPEAIRRPLVHDLRWDAAGIQIFAIGDAVTQ
ncbi:MAG: bacillithiol biosynthesis BshC [Acidobacteria bacterium]|nr:bacillithiol biosynthesis BshC [Acidobacteriota bacterium]